MRKQNSCSLASDLHSVSSEIQFFGRVFSKRDKREGTYSYTMIARGLVALLRANDPVSRTNYKATCKSPKSMSHTARHSPAVGVTLSTCICDAKSIPMTNNHRNSLIHLMGHF